VSIVLVDFWGQRVVANFRTRKLDRGIYDTTFHQLVCFDVSRCYGNNQCFQQSRTVAHIALKLVIVFGSRRLLIYE